jgi:hypothetical protein
MPKLDESRFQRFVHAGNQIPWGVAPGSDMRSRRWR